MLSKLKQSSGNERNCSRKSGDVEMNETIRGLLAKVGGLPVSVTELEDNADLYAAGLSSFASVQLMLAIEEQFDIEFPDNLLNRKSFASISAIEATVTQILKSNEAA
jgi:acyl carrier protein